MAHFWTIFQLVLFSIVLPVIDKYGDINFSIRAVMNNHYFIACLIISPVVANVIFVGYAWINGKFDSNKEKWLTWIFVVLNIWPIYQVCKLIRAITGKKEQNNWQNDRKKLERHVFSIEPWIEAIPQYIISVCVFDHYICKGGSEQIQDIFQDRLITFTEDIEAALNGTRLEVCANKTTVEDIFGEYTLGFLPTRVMFPINAAISFIVGVHSIIIYLTNGPLKITSENCILSSILFVAKLVYVAISFVSLLLGAVVQNKFVSEYGLPGYWTFIFIVASFVIIPFLLVSTPLIRHLGFIKSMKMILGNPQLVILPVVTDYVIGPVSGYGKCHTGRCCWWQCCCWMFCCKPCKFESGHKIRIHKKMSLAKMVYKQIFFYSIPVYSAIACLIPQSSYLIMPESITFQCHVLGPYAVSFLATWLIGTISFMVSLLGSCSSLDVDNFEQENFES